VIRPANPSRACEQAATKTTQVCQGPFITGIVPIANWDGRSITVAALI